MSIYRIGNSQMGGLTIVCFLTLVQLSWNARTGCRLITTKRKSVNQKVIIVPLLHVIPLVKVDVNKLLRTAWYSIGFYGWVIINSYSALQQYSRGFIVNSQELTTSAEGSYILSFGLYRTLWWLCKLLRLKLSPYHIILEPDLVRQMQQW